MIQSIDKAFLNFTKNNLHCKFLDYTMPKISYLGNFGMIWILISIMLFFKKSNQLMGLAVALGLFSSVIFGNIILKPLVKRARPCHIDNTLNLLILCPKDFSFPSGHALSSVICAVIILNFNIIFGTIALIFALLVSFSRLYLLVHYLSDVIAGIILGLIIGNWVFSMVSIIFVIH